MNNKVEYNDFVKKNYIPIYSQPWWLDAICGAGNWDVWLYKKGNEVLAAMPYYFENRNGYRYITKAPLTQNNGIIFHCDMNSKRQKVASFEEKVIDSMVEWLDSMNIDVYEQQYVHTFNNWQPFFWNGFKCIIRYTYIIEDTSDLEKVKLNYSAKLRNDLKKGERNSQLIGTLEPEQFYCEHEKIFLKQDLQCPFSKELWLRLYEACVEHNSGKTVCIYNHEGKISSLAFFVWDDRYVYLLMGGGIPELSSENTFGFLVHKGIELASSMGKGFDFEGSMIKRIAKAFRDYGGIPMPYYRIRKVYNPEIIQMEADLEKNALKRGK